MQCCYTSLFALGWFFDMTDRKQAAEALRQSDRRKDEFLATLAHELRNPLAPIRNGLQLLKLTSDPATWEQARAMMERQLAQMVRLVDDLMDISRITRLGHRLDALAARPLRLGVLAFGGIILASFGLPLRRLPAPHQAQAGRILAVTLVPTPWPERLSTTFAQAQTRTRPSAAAVWLMLMVAHGSVLSQGTARGERANVLLGRFSTVHVGGHCQLYFAEKTRQGKKLLEKGAATETAINQTAKETVLQLHPGRTRRTTPGSRPTLETGSLFSLSPNVPQDIVKGTTTRSPFLSFRTPLPTSITSPMGSWPRTSPFSIVGMYPFKRCKSEPHMPLAVIRTIASPGSLILGSGTVSIRTSPLPCQQSAFIATS